MSAHPWRGSKAIQPNQGAATGQEPRRRHHDLSECEYWTGKTEAELDAWHAEQRRRVRERLGLKP